VNRTKNSLQTVLLWIAQGCGIGRFPVAPGTLGSAAGLLWFFVLVAAANLWTYLACTFVLFAFAVWSCQVAEEILKLKDPSSVVLDEIAAMPLCFLTWVGILLATKGKFPALEDFVPDHWPGVLGVLIAFRVFDIWKPWPIRQSQTLPGGWGVTIDDTLAALYVNVSFAICYALKFFLTQSSFGI
jgi:phosphatidylglycerophosphatase A